MRKPLPPTKTIKKGIGKFYDSGNAANGEQGSPVEKVVTMLEDLQTQVIEEGKAEAGTC